MPSVYMTVEGRSCDTTRAIAQSRARLGAESSKDWLEGYTPQFVDFPFTDPDATFADHLAVVKQTCPTLTVAPDIEKGRTLSDVVRKADRLLQYSRNVIVVPKSVRPSRVPNRFRVGVPLADFGSGAPWAAWDYQDCGPVHLLGGGPARQLKTAECIPVASVDTATLGKTSRFGYWNNGTKDAPDKWDYQRRLKESLNNYVGVWQQ